MSTTVEPTVQWSQDQMVEVLLNEPDDFLKVRETLTRIGVASRKEKKLYQSCHILHKQGRYFIVHFKELFALDGKHANLTVNDVQRRNRIVRLLADWGLISVVKEDAVLDIAPLNQTAIRAKFRKVYSRCLHIRTSLTGYLSKSIISARRERPRKPNKSKSQEVLDTSFFICYNTGVF